MNNELPEKDELVRALRSHGARAMHVGELCGRLKVPRRAREDIVRLLLLLVEEGLVQELPGLRFRAVSKKGQAPPTRKAAPRPKKRALSDFDMAPPVLEGHLTVTTQGYGFVNVYDGSSDVFIPPDAMGPALHDDRVQLRARPSSKGREGRIVGIVERRQRKITGTLRTRGRNVVFEPDDQRLRSPMRIVGKPPKKDSKDKVTLAEIVRFPQRVEDRADVRILDVLGSAGITQVEVDKIKIREGIAEEFPDDVKEEAKKLPSRIERAELQRREDLREIDLVTIDPETARDHDDALWVQRERGGFRLVVAIADVSHYVEENTAIDREAIQRGTSIYLPDRAIPMLPPELSTNLASLVPDHDRLCMAVEVHLDENASITSHRIMEGVMRSRAKLTYEGVARALSLTEDGPKQPAAEKRVPTLQALLELARKLRTRRLRRGALDFDLPEAKIILDAKTQEPSALVQSRKDPGVRETYRLVEEMMLLANEVVASHLKKRGIPAVFRVHGTPDAERVRTFCEVAKSLGFSLDEKDALNPKHLSKFLTRIEGTPQAPLLRYLLLRAMQQAIYDTDPTLGHFALATEDYLHFTSPIRRYPDLVVHRIVRSVVRDKAIDAPTLRSNLRRFAARASELERRAITVERDVVDLYRAIFMQKHIGDVFEGRIVGFAPHGIYVQLDEPFAAVLLPFEQMDDSFEPDRLGIRLIGRRSAKVFTMSDRVVVRVEDVDMLRRNVIASLMEHVATTQPTRAPEKSRGGDRKKPGGDRKKRGGDGKKRGGDEKRPGGGRKGEGTREQAGKPRRRKRKR